MSGQLAIEFAVGYHTSEYVPRNADDPSGLKISLIYEGGIYSNSKEDLCFENSLLRIQKQLPDGVFIKSCITCLYSDYSPYGNGMFGSMMCFRNIKAEYIKVKSKKDFWSVYKREDRWVQETYLCSEFERRIPGTGYRG